MTYDWDEREVERKTKRAQKEAAKLRGQTDLTTKEAECSEDEAAFNQNLKRITKQTAKPKKQPHKATK